MHQACDIQDTQLWDGLRKGHKQALSDLFLRYAGSLSDYGFMLCRDKELVKDQIQDLFFELWKKKDTLQEVQKVEKYLSVALRNRIIEHFRQRKEVLSLHTYDITQSESLLAVSDKQEWLEAENQNLQSEMIRKAVNSLPKRMRQAIHLRYFEGFEYTTIAQIMNIRHQVAVNMVYRATQKLRSYSKQYSELMFILLVISVAIGIS